MMSTASRLNKVFGTLCFWAFCMSMTHAQKMHWNMRLPYYPFIQYDSNILKTFDHGGMDRSFELLKHVQTDPDKKFSILHFGGSHIQADIYTHRVRYYLQHACYSCTGERGFITPYSIAKTNNPYNYKVNSTGNWYSSKITNKSKCCDLGVSGITVYTSDTSASISLNMAVKKNYAPSSNEITLFHNAPQHYQITPILPDSIQVIEKDSIPGVLNIKLSHPIKEITFDFKRQNKTIDTLEVYGFYFGNDQPGITYNTVGVNGAAFHSFLKENILDKHLQEINPNLVILSIGTNDANHYFFKKETYKQNFKAFLDSIQKATPDVDFIFTVPNDSYIQGKDINKNTLLVREAIYELAVEYEAGVWDFFEVMGGLGSIESWAEDELAKEDHIHFTTKGYYLKGDLFFIALINAYNRYLEQ